MCRSKLCEVRYGAFGECPADADLRRGLPANPLDQLRATALAPYAGIYEGHLSDRGYAPSTRGGYLRCLVHFGRWMSQCGLDPEDLDEEVVAQFLDGHLPHCRCPAPVGRMRADLRAALGHLLVVLRANAVIPERVLETTPVAEELRRFDVHMDRVRALSATTRRLWRRTVHRFLLQQFGDSPIDLSVIKPEAVRRFVADQSAHYSSLGGVATLISALRSYFHFRTACGDHMQTLSAVMILEERHRLGFASCSRGHALRSFAAYVDGLQLTGPLPVEVMARWARCPKDASDDPLTWARRLKLLRPFARWFRQFEPGTEVPDNAIFGSVAQRLAPHIYTEQEISDLLAAAHRLQPPLRGATYETLFGLLAATGLRLSEAVHLLDRDVDLKAGLLQVRQTKFAKSRQVPVHPTTLAALRRYATLRDREVAATEEAPFFVGTRGRRHGCMPSLRQVDRVFQQLREQLGWGNRGAHAAPRVHDLRHAFVVGRILRWQEEGTDIDQQMLALSTYVGHANVTNTYWYLSAVPKLLARAAARFEPLMEDTEVDHV